MSRRLRPLRYIMNLHCSEVLTRTHVHLQVGQWSPEHPRTEKLLVLDFWTESTGTDDPQGWVKDMLVEAIEQL